MTCDGPARSCVTPAAVSLSRFNSCWVTHRCKPRNATLVASKIFEAPYDRFYSGDRYRWLMLVEVVSRFAVFANLARRERVLHW